MWIRVSPKDSQSLHPSLASSLTDVRRPPQGSPEPRWLFYLCMCVCVCVCVCAQSLSCVIYLYVLSLPLDKLLGGRDNILFSVSLDLSTSSVPRTCVCVCVCACVCERALSHVWEFATLLTVACQAPMCIGFSRQGYWSELPFPLPGDRPDTGIKPLSLTSPALAGGFITTAAPGKPFYLLRQMQNFTLT